MYNILYYDGGDSAKRAVVEEVLQSFFVSYRCIAWEEASKTIGTLFEHTTRHEHSHTQTAINNNDLMILHELADETIQAISNALREKQVHVERKAMLTKHNITWKFSDLLKEIEDEHAYFGKYDEIKQAILAFQSMKEDAYTKQSWLIYQNAVVQGYALLQERANKEQLDKAMLEIQQAFHQLQTQ